MGSMSPPQSSVAQETSQNAALASAISGSLVKSVLYNDNGAIGADANITWDKAKRQAAISGGATYSALNLIGNNIPTFGDELLTNPNFASGLTGWTANAGAVLHGSEVWLYNGIPTTVVKGSSGGTGYTLNDVLTVVANLIQSPVTMTANNLPSPYVVSATSYYNNSSTYAPFKACDSDWTSTYWMSNAVPSSGTPQNWMVDCGASISASVLKLWSKAGGNHPKNFKLQRTESSNPGLGTDGDWIDVLTVADNTDPGAGVSQTWTFTAAASRYWRIRITDPVAGGSYVGFVGFQLLLTMDGGLTVTASGVNAGAVTAVTMVTPGRQYVVANGYSVTGGTGAGCLINITAVTSGSISQTPTFSVGQTYRGKVTFSASNDSNVSLSAPSFSPEYLLGSTGGVLETALTEWSNIVSSGGVGGSVGVTLYAGSSVASIAKIAGVSYKHVTGFGGSAFDLQDPLGASYGATKAIGDSTHGSIYIAGAGTNHVTGYGNLGIGYNALSDNYGGCYDTAIGYSALDGYYQPRHGNVVIGSFAGQNANNYYLTLVGYSAGGVSALTGDSVGPPGEGCVGLGAYSFQSCTGTGGQGCFGGGEFAGQYSSATYSVYLGYQAGVSNTTNESFIVATQGSTYFLQGVNDRSGATGYLKLRGSFYPSVDNAYDLHLSTTNRWKALALTGKFGCNGSAPATQAVKVADATGTDAAIINAIRTCLIDHGFMAAA